MVIYTVIGLVISRRVKGVDDFYVAGRKAPVILIAGSMIASYTSTGMFMGDAAQCYDGVFSPIIIFAGMQSAGYIIGAVFFGRYLRRCHVLTIPEFFGKRFCSEAMRKLAAVTAIITMTVYLLSVIQGIGTLMSSVTGVGYNYCVLLSIIVFTVITVTSGSRGVLITDTLMAGTFTAAMLIASFVIAKNAGGWFTSIERIAADGSLSDILSWGGKSGVLYNSGGENVLWGVIYGVVWMSVCMVGPWQSSRYLMAKNEHTVVKSSLYASLGVFLLEFIVGMAAVMVNAVNSGLEDSSQVMIWAAMNMMPKLLGVILLTGVLAAGISSATTFLSLIGASVANDIMPENESRAIRIGRIAMVIASAAVLAVAVFNPPSIFWIMFLGGAIVASSWMPVAVASIFSKRLTRAGAFAGMLTGFLGCFVLRLYSALAGITLPVYLDPSIVGIVLNIAAMVIATLLTSVSAEEKEAREALFVIPDSEKNVIEIKKTLSYARATVLVGVMVALGLIILWALPYYRGM